VTAPRRPVRITDEITESPWREGQVDDRGVHWVLTTQDELLVRSVAAHVDESLVRDSHQVRDFVHDDMS
jgi:hypothetical protein